MKPQTVRLVDVFLLGPFMVWVGARAKGLPQWAGAAMVVAGVGTVVYNARNYLRHRARERDLQLLEDLRERAEGT